MSKLSLVCALTAVAAALIGVGATARPAVAGAKPKVDLLCGVYVDGDITDVVPSARRPRLTQPVACVLHLRKPGRATYQANLATRRHLRAPNGDATDVFTDGVFAQVAHPAGGDATDLELVMVPGQENDNGEVLFATCEDFDIVGRLTDDAGAVVWEQTLKVVQGCPRLEPPPAPLPPGRFNGAGVGNDVVDWILSGDGSQPWRAFAVPVGAQTYYVIGGCSGVEMQATCEATVFDARGARKKQVAVSITLPYGDDEQLDLTELELARADLDQALDHAGGVELIPHPLGARPLTYDPIGLAWDARRATLTIRDRGKVFKKVKAPRTPRGMRIDEVALYYQEGGDPVLGILRVQRSEVEGIGSDAALVPTRLPTIDNE